MMTNTVLVFTVTRKPVDIHHPADLLDILHLVGIRLLVLTRNTVDIRLLSKEVIRVTRHRVRVTDTRDIRHRVHTVTHNSKLMVNHRNQRRAEEPEWG
jgi:hypothetical protein